MQNKNLGSADSLIPKSEPAEPNCSLLIFLKKHYSAFSGEA